jgi:AcrR family transcriptional regulator
MNGELAAANLAEDTSQEVVLLEKNRPRQQRAIKTYEAILESASHLLCEVGLERISTNLIAERAGVTVPALYRYFPNKYAVLYALGARLMDRHNEVFTRWHQQHVKGRPAEAMLDGLYPLLRDTYEVTRDCTGGLEIMHGMQAMVPLQQVRLDSHWAVAEFFGQMWTEKFGVRRTEVTDIRARVAVDLGLAAVQMALEDSRMNPDEALREGAAVLQAYLKKVVRDAHPEFA